MQKPAVVSAAVAMVWLAGVSVAFGEWRPRQPRATTPHPADAGKPDILVKLRPGADPALVHERVARRRGVPPVPRAARSLLRGAAVGAAARAAGLDRWQEVYANGADVDALLQTYRADPGVEYAEPNQVVSTLDTRPNDPSFGQQWGLQKIEAPLAWDLTQGSTDVAVGIIDTGIDYTHPDLAANLWVNPGEIAGNGIDDDGNGFVDDVYGYDFVNNDGDPLDGNGHGTHVAGIVGAVGNNAAGVSGVNWRTRLAAIQVIGANGTGFVSDAVRGVSYAVQMGLRVTNNSYGSSGYSQAMHDAIAAARAAGQLFVAAAGNNSSSNDLLDFFPADDPLENVISVAASDQNDALASFSNFGAVSVDLSAPGVGILSTVPTYSVTLTTQRNYASFSGTSMASPHVAGAAALLWARAPALRYDEVRARLLAGGDSVGHQTVTGRRLNVAGSFAGLGIGQDTVAPAAVTDLVSTAVTHRTVQIEFTASGDDGGSGRAALYDVRVATAPITELTWGQAAAVFDEPYPQPPGAHERFSVSGLAPGTAYYVAMRVMDEAGNYSALSNLAVATTLSIDQLVMELQSGDRQVGPGGRPLPEPLGVVVRDVNGEGIPGIPVTFSVLEGLPGATFPAPDVTTNADGIAYATPTLGDVPRGTAGIEHRFAAAAAGIQPVEFVAGAEPLVDLQKVWESPQQRYTAFATGDADGDGLGDLVTLVYDRADTGARMQVWESVADNQLQKVWEELDPSEPVYNTGDVAIGDCDGDGVNEIVAFGPAPFFTSAPYEPLIYEATGDNAYARVATNITVPSTMSGSVDPPQPVSAEAVLVGDTNQNGQPEVILVYESINGSEIAVWEHVGAPGEHTYERIFVDTTSARPTNRPELHATLADTDDDGRLEVVPTQEEQRDLRYRYALRLENDVPTGRPLLKDGFDLMQVFDARPTEFDFAAAIRPLTADLDGDGRSELIAPGYYGCRCILIIIGNAAQDYSPNPLEPCDAGNLAVFRATGDDVYEPVWSNVGTITCSWGLERQLYDAAVGRLNALPPDLPALAVVGSRDVDVGAVYAHNPFPFRPEYLLPLWKAPADVLHRYTKVAWTDLDSDGRPELLAWDPDGLRLTLFEENLEVRENLPPELNAVGDKRVLAGAPLVFTVSATDPNRDPLVYDVAGLPSGATFDAAQRRFAWTAAADQVGLYPVRFSVTDGTFSDSEDILIHVERDQDGDGVIDAPDPLDNCPTLFNPDQRDQDGDGVGDACDVCPLTAGAPLGDADGDGTDDLCDNCVGVANPGQADGDADALGDACDACPADPANDQDGDGRCGDVDNCPAVANSGQEDGDFDGVGDVCDNCVALANSNQRDTDSDGQGDACDGTVDADLCPGGRGALVVEKLTLRYSTSLGPKLKLKGAMASDATASLAARPDVTILAVADGTPLTSLRVPAALLIANRSGSTYALRDGGSGSDGLTRVKLSRQRDGSWKLKALGVGVAAGPPGRHAEVLVRIGDRCYTASAALVCDVNALQTAMHCEGF